MPRRADGPSPLSAESGGPTGSGREDVVAEAELARLSSSVVYEWAGPPRLQMIRDDVHPAGRARYQTHRLVTADGAAGVVVWAERGDDVLFVRHARSSVGRFLLELPRGFGEEHPAVSEDDAARADAERELREETGYRSRSSRVIGRYILDSSLLPGENAVVSVIVDDSLPVLPSDGEADGNVWVAKSEILLMLRDGAFEDGHTLAAFALVSAARA